MPAPAPSPAQRAIAAAFYAPIGLGAQLVDDLPKSLTQARQQIAFARFIGKMAVDQGVNELRKRLTPDAVSDAPAAAAVTDSAPDAAHTVPPSPAPAPQPSAIPGDVPAVETLALPDYEQLPAAHIVGKLAGLDAAELDAVEAYELAHRHRRTVLGKITQLRGS